LTPNHQRQSTKGTFELQHQDQYYTFFN